MEWTQIGHRSGNTPKALNVLWGDGRVNSSTGPKVFNPDAAHWNAAAGFGGGPGEPAADQQFLNIMAAIQP